MLGLVVNGATLQTLYRGFKLIFQGAFDSVTSDLPKLWTEVKSTTAGEEYAWIGMMPNMREWIGERVIKSLAAAGYYLKNKDFELTLGVPRNNILDDNLGLFTPLLESLARAAKLHPAELLAAILKAGETNLAFDGKPFFATDHPNGAQTPFSNLFAATALTADNYGAVRAAMMSYINDAGNPLGIIPDTLIIPPQLEKVARSILTADVIIGDATAGGSQSNVWKNSANLLLAPELADHPTEWYVACLNRPLKPFIYQLRQAPEFVSLTAPDDDNVFMRKEYLYGVDYRGNVGYGLPHLIAKARA
ncbi:MAG: Mu-like prophage major head subunit gpT family protein [Nitrospinae bacterium]|nr:Mu-like prophage major head subunit gpT family protein [Nitrospinota bacterium]